MRRVLHVLTLSVPLLLLATGCEDGLDPHWACQDVQSHAGSCASGCQVADACEGQLDTLDASELDTLGACAHCLREEADTGTCRDCATAATVSCRETLALWLDTPCLTP